MLCRHVFGKISSDFFEISRDFADLLEIHGFVTAQNIRSPGKCNTQLTITVTRKESYGPLVDFTNLGT